MGFFKDPKPYTAISEDIERLLEEKGDDPARLVDAIELIQAHPQSGGVEAGRVLRKRIKYGRGNDQVRVVVVTEMLVDNGGKQMTAMVTDSGLGDLLVALASPHSSVSTSPKANKLAQALLLRWSRSSNKQLAVYFGKAGLREKTKGSHSRSKSGSSARSRNRDEGAWGDDDDEYDDEYGSGRGRGPRDGDDDLRGSSRSRTRTNRARSPSRSPSPINLREASLTTTIATAHSVATRLNNSLILTDQHPRKSRETRGYYRQCKQLRHRVVELIHSPKSDVQAYLDQLLQANEELVAALQAHDNVMAGGYVAGRNDHAQLVDADPVQPIRPPPSPRRARYDDDDDDDDHGVFSDSSRHTPGSPRSKAPIVTSSSYDPFGDDNEEAGLPKHTPIW